jgi:hypothetical protein
VGNSEQLGGENIIHDQKLDGGSSKKEQPARIKRERERGGGDTKNELLLI